MDEPVLSAQDLLTAWKDAKLGADLAARLAEAAEAAAEQAETDAVASEELATLAEAAAQAASRAADNARAFAERARARASAQRGGHAPMARQRAVDANAQEAAAREAFEAGHDAERSA